MSLPFFVFFLSIRLGSGASFLPRGGDDDDDEDDEDDDEDDEDDEDDDEDDEEEDNCGDDNDETEDNGGNIFSLSGVSGKFRTFF